MSLNEGIFVNTIVPKKRHGICHVFPGAFFIFRVDEPAMFFVPVGF